MRALSVVNMYGWYLRTRLLWLENKRQQMENFAQIMEDVCHPAGVPLGQ